MRVRTDQVETILFPKALQTYKSIDIVSLAGVFMKKLSMDRSNAVKFARFLIEEKDDDKS
jgi:hypothetical protein